MPDEVKEMYINSESSGFDELNAYKNSDGTYCIEMHNFNHKFSIPRATVEININGGIGLIPAAEIKFTGGLI